MPPYSRGLDTMWSPAFAMLRIAKVSAACPEASSSAGGPPPPPPRPPPPGPPPVRSPVSAARYCASATTGWLSNWAQRSNPRWL